jgi:alcohol dehydrogenase class IV
MAVEGVQSLFEALPRIVNAPKDKDARSRALYGAWLCGICLGSVGMALHHKLCHTLGGTFDLPHAETHTVLLPHAVAYNRSAARSTIAQFESALGVPNLANALFELAGRVNAPQTLSALGMPRDGIERAADLALANPYWNPRPLSRSGIHELLVNAYEGRLPVAN